MGNHFCLSSDSNPNETTAAYSIMISSHSSDMIPSESLRESLAKRGYTVYTSAISGAAFSNVKKIGESILNAQVFIPLLSLGSLSDPPFRNSLALAYLSNKIIIPCSLGSQSQLLNVITNVGMLLQVLEFEWVMFDDARKFQKSFDILLERLKTESSASVSLQPASNISNNRYKLRSTRSSNNLKKLYYGHLSTKLPISNKVVSKGLPVESNRLFDIDFWKENWIDVKEVMWDSFQTAFLRTYGDLLSKICPREKDFHYVFNMMRHEMCVSENERLSYNNYLEFCTVEGVYKSIWSRVEEQTASYYSICEVFEMDSGVRIAAIENLGKYRSPAVLEMLEDLLFDTDCDTRAVAAITLARCNASRKGLEEALFCTLQDEDRIVRQAGCLALGHLGVQKAVPQLVKLWREDLISVVRDSAQVALDQIGGPEAKKQLHVTHVLENEIRALSAVIVK